MTGLEITNLNACYSNPTGKCYEDAFGMVNVICTGAAIHSSLFLPLHCPVAAYYSIL
jgi:hypothetical protein